MNARMPAIASLSVPVNRVDVNSNRNSPTISAGESPQPWPGNDISFAQSDASGTAPSPITRIGSSPNHARRRSGISAASAASAIRTTRGPSL